MINNYSNEVENCQAAKVSLFIVHFYLTNINDTYFLLHVHFAENCGHMFNIEINFNS